MLRRFCDHQFWSLQLQCLIVIGSTIAFVQNCALAQPITPDNSLGAENSVVNSGVEIDNNLSTLIEGGAMRGVNLFHSFAEFGVGNGQSVLFNNPAGIERILSRVTGNSRSEILGQLGVYGGNADLFLINPNGIIFGPNASLNLKGSFVGTTASSITFADGTQFSAANPSAPPLLTVSVPIGLQFGKTPESIINQSQAQVQVQIGDSSAPVPVGLQVEPGKTLALVGGDITIQGGLLDAPEGRIELGSVAANGQVTLQPIETGWALGYESVQNFRDIQLLNGSSIGANGEGGGDIQLQGREVTLADGSRIFAGVNRGAQSGGTLSITASDSVKLIGTIPNDPGRRSGLVTSTTSAGDAGNIIIDTGRLLLQDGASILTSSLVISIPPDPVIRASGGAGDLTVSASEFVEISNGSRLNTQTQGSGDAGTLKIETRELIIRDNSEITSSADLGSEGQGGNLIINTDSLSVSDGSQIRAATSGQGRSGNILINAVDTVDISGVSSITGLSSGLFTNTSEDDSGRGGSITVNTRALRISDKAELNASTSSDFMGGGIEVNVNTLDLTDGGRIVTNAFSNGNAGDISLRVSDLLRLRRNSEISTAGTAGTTGDGGDIKIDAPFIVAVPEENSDISASAFRGDGGNINITTEAIFGIGFQEVQNPISDITASSEFGLDGVVEITSPNVDPNQGLVKLPEEPVDLARLIDENLCSVSKDSEFIITGRSGLSTSPDQALSPNAVWEDWRLEESSEQGEQVQQSRSRSRIVSDPKQGTNDPTRGQIVEFKGWAFNARGNVVLTAQANTVNPQGVWLPAPACQ